MAAHTVRDRVQSLGDFDYRELVLPLAGWHGQFGEAPQERRPRRVQAARKLHMIQPTRPMPPDLAQHAWHAVAVRCVCRWSQSPAVS